MERRPDVDLGARRRRRLAFAAPLLVLSLTISMALLSQAQAGPGGAAGLGALGVRGGDISFTPQLEAAGVTFRDHGVVAPRSEEHTSELQSPVHLVCRL